MNASGQNQGRAGHRTAFVAVRATPDGKGRWMDIATVASTPGDSLAVAGVAAKNLPGWSRANPVERVARVEIREID